MMSTNESTPTLMSWLTFNPKREAQHGEAPRMRSDHRAAAFTHLRESAPYAAMLILPGGSVMALLLWLYRRQKRPRFYPAQ